MDLVIAGFFQLPSASPAEAAGGAEPDSGVPAAAFASLLDLAARDPLLAVADAGDCGASAWPCEDAGDAEVSDGGAGPPLAAIVPLAVPDAAPRPAGPGDESIALPASRDGEPEERIVLWHTVPVAVDSRVEASLPTTPPDVAARSQVDGAAPPHRRLDQEPQGPAGAGAPSPAVVADDQVVADDRAVAAADSLAAETPAVSPERPLPRPRAAISLARALATLTAESAGSDCHVGRAAAVDPQAPSASATGASSDRESPLDAATKRESQTETPVQPPLKPQRVALSADLPPPARVYAASAVHQKPLAVAPPAAASPTLAAGRLAPEDRDVIPQLVRAMRTQFRAGIGEARIRLHPEHLGEVRVSVRIDGDRVSALLQVERADVRRAIEAQSDVLRAGLTAQGLVLEHLSVRQEVTVRPQAREDADQRGQPRDHAAPQRRGKKRQPDREFELQE